MTHLCQVDVYFPLTLDLLENKREDRINFLIAIALEFLLILDLIEIT
jgi:hypothetical protein